MLTPPEPPRKEKRYEKEEEEEDQEEEEEEGGEEYVIFFINGLKGFFPSTVFFLISIISFMRCFIILCMLAMSVGSLSFFSVYVIRIPFFFVFFSD